MPQRTDDQTFIETKMYTGRASRRPVVQLLNRGLPGAFLLAGGVGIASGFIRWMEGTTSRFYVPVAGGSKAVTDAMLLGAAMAVAGVWLLVLALRAYGRDRAAARRADAMPTVPRVRTDGTTAPPERPRR